MQIEEKYINLKDFFAANNFVQQKYEGKLKVLLSTLTTDEGHFLEAYNIFVDDTHYDCILTFSNENDKKEELLKAYLEAYRKRFANERHDHRVFALSEADKTKSLYNILSSFTSSYNIVITKQNPLYKMRQVLITSASSL